MKTILYAVILLILVPCAALAQLEGPGGSGGSNATAVAAQINDSLNARLVFDATNPGEMPYFNKTRDTLYSRPFYSAPAWTIDSSMVSTSFKKMWFRTTADSLAVDSLWGITRNATSCVLRVLIAKSAASMTDSLTDLTVSSQTVGTLAASTKVIPPYSQVWLQIVTVTGAVGDVTIGLNARRRW